MKTVIKLTDQDTKTHGVLNAELVEALTALTATARTFRSVPKSEQDWGPLDDEALNAAFAALAKCSHPMNRSEA
jgi:hypothetical protein